jgi:hypothetical protein
MIKQNKEREDNEKTRRATDSQRKRARETATRHRTRLPDTLFELMYENKATLSSVLLIKPRITHTYDDYAQESKERIRAANQVAKENLRKEK